MSYLVTFASLFQYCCEASRYEACNYSGYQTMNGFNPTAMDILRLLFTGVLGGIVGAFANDFFSRRRERKTLKRHFIGRMSFQKSAADIIEDFDIWFGRSKPIIEQECAMVEDAIHHDWRERFFAARTKYANAQRKDIEDFDNATLSMPKIMTYNIRGRPLVIALLQELIDCASH